MEDNAKRPWAKSLYVGRMHDGTEFLPSLPTYYAF
ncbi:uncharacterized protein G2W53_040257 [Senna tora]|uniref:Uncharacterized protein n=1 Tax=Senna tora TaxID=362788 RepID=A0A834SRA1_9FABA|nr:uncharacterized protein G2W53_040257 [Senna tora]